MTTTIKGFAAAQRHKGGFEKWVYDMIVSLANGESGDTAAIEALQEAIGDESTENTILYRIKALETAAANSGSGGSGSGGSGSS